VEYSVTTKNEDKETEINDFGSYDSELDIYGGVIDAITTQFDFREKSKNKLNDFFGTVIRVILGEPLNGDSYGSNCFG